MPKGFPPRQSAPSRRRTWLLVRIAIYLVVVAVLFSVRGHVSWRRFLHLVQTPSTNSLTVIGRSLAPDLVDRLVLSYRSSYPGVTIRIQTGGSNRALEAVANGEADVAFLSRPVTADEQTYLRSVKNDTVVAVPIAVEAIELLVGAACDTAPVTVDAVRAIVVAGSRTVYLPDPNEGLWDALRARLDLAEPDPPAGSPVVFLADEAAVVGAVVADSTAWGFVSALASDPGDLTRLRVGPAAAAPTYTAVATGDYPLYQRLYAVCLADGSIEARKFVTHLASPRGLRQVERAGVVPAAQTARTIILTREPVGH